VGSSPAVRTSKIKQIAQTVRTRRETSPSVSALCKRPWRGPWRTVRRPGVQGQPSAETQWLATAASRRRQSGGPGARKRLSLSVRWRASPNTSRRTASRHVRFGPLSAARTRSKRRAYSITSSARASSIGGSAARRERFVGLANICSGAYLCGYNIDFQLLSRSPDFSALRASFWVSHII
jgi:hypothetical protein